MIVCDLSEFAGPKKDRKESVSVAATADEAPPVAHDQSEQSAGARQLERELDELRKARTFWRERAEAAEARAAAAEGAIRAADKALDMLAFYHDPRAREHREEYWRIRCKQDAAIDAAIAAQDAGKEKGA